MALDPILTRELATPLGPMLAGAVGDGLCLLEFHDRRLLTAEREELSERLGRAVVGDEDGPGRGHLDSMERELREYFAGERRAFETKLLTPGTEFENRVWAELLRIPFAATCSYGQMAGRLGNAGASRAVGRANGRNRIAIVIPCHRVIESTGALRGYGGGLERKRWLLEHEAKVAGVLPTLFS